MESGIGTHVLFVQRQNLICREQRIAENKQAYGEENEGIFGYDILDLKQEKSKRVKLGNDIKTEKGTKGY